MDQSVPINVLHQQQRTKYQSVAPLEMMQLVASDHFTIPFAFVTFTHLKYKYNNKRQGYDLPQGI